MSAPGNSPSFLPFEYLRFAKTTMNGATHELCMSGVPHADPSFVGETPPHVERAHVEPLMDEWRALVSSRWGLPADHLLPSLGASGGAYLSVASCVSLVRDRDRGTPIVAIERPAYPVFEVSARLAGAHVVRFDRTAAEHFAVDPSRVEAVLTDGARVVCLTNLQNPASVALAPEELDALRELARRFDAWIVLDEVYRDFLPGDVGSDYLPGERVICTSSLTKCYGVGPLRAGWIAAPPEVLDRAESLVEITHGVDSVPAGDAVVRALRHADALLAGGRESARRGRRVMDAWVDATPGVTWVPPAGGITGLVHVEGMTDSRATADRLRADLDVQVVAGAFFDADDALRVSFGTPPAQLSRALETLALGLAALL